MRRDYTEEDIVFLRKFGENVRRLRELAKLSQADLETDSKMSKNQIGRIERGEISTTITNLNNIAKALKVDIKELFNLPPNN